MDCFGLYNSIFFKKKNLKMLSFERFLIFQASLRGQKGIHQSSILFHRPQSIQNTYVPTKGMNHGFLRMLLAFHSHPQYLVATGSGSLLSTLIHNTQCPLGQAACEENNCCKDTLGQITISSLVTELLTYIFCLFEIILFSPWQHGSVYHQTLQHKCLGTIS